MNTEDMSVIQSPAARQMKDYCWNLGHQLDLPLERVCWGQDISTAGHPKHELAIKVKGLSHPRNIEFSREQIEGYVAGLSRAEVQDKIQAELEDVLQTFQDIEED
jgi:hypothetical protein